MAAETDKVNVGVLATITLIGAFSMVGIAAALTALVRHEADEESLTKNATSDVRPYQEMLKEQQTELNATPSWVDKNKGSLTIPIGQAMDNVVRDIHTDPARATAPLSASTRVPGSTTLPPATSAETPPPEQGTKPATGQIRAPDAGAPPPKPPTPKPTPTTPTGGAPSGAPAVTTAQPAPTG